MLILFFKLNHETSKRFLDLMGSKCVLLCPHPCSHMYTHRCQWSGQSGIAVMHGGAKDVLTQTLAREACLLYRMEQVGRGTP